MTFKIVSGRKDFCYQPPSLKERRLEWLSYKTEKSFVKARATSFVLFFIRNGQTTIFGMERDKRMVSIHLERSFWKFDKRVFAHQGIKPKFVHKLIIPDYLHSGAFSRWVNNGKIPIFIDILIILSKVFFHARHYSIKKIVHLEISS